MHSLGGEWVGVRVVDLGEGARSTIDLMVGWFAGSGKSQRATQHHMGGHISKDG